MTATEQPNLHPDSPLQDWKVIRMLAALGAPLECNTTGDMADHNWVDVPSWADTGWWDCWSEYMHITWAFRRKS